MTPATRSPLLNEELLGVVTVPEKSQPITFEGGSAIEACLSGKGYVCNIKLQRQRCKQSVGFRDT